MFRLRRVFALIFAPSVRFPPSTAAKTQKNRLRRKTNHSDVIAYLVFSPPMDKKVPVIFLGFPNPQNFCYRLFIVQNQLKTGFRGY